MEYYWERRDRVWHLWRLDLSLAPALWGRELPIGRIRRVKNKISCKKFVVDVTSDGGWEYVTLLNMKLSEAQDVARVLLITRSNYA